MSTLNENLSELLKLDQSIETYKRKFLSEEGIARDDVEPLLNAAIRFCTVRSDVMLEFADQPTIAIHDPKKKKLLSEISSGKKFTADVLIEVLNDVTGSDIESQNFWDYKTLDDIGTNTFYSWFDLHKYMRDLMHIGILVTGKRIPPHIRIFLEEGRQCYAFGQYNAMFSLCRTILEATMREVAYKLGKTPPPRDDRSYYKEYPPYRLFNLVSSGRKNAQLREIYHRVSSLIHGFRTADSSVAADVFRESIEIAEYLFDRSQRY